MEKGKKCSRTIGSLQNQSNIIKTVSQDEQTLIHAHSGWAISVKYLSVWKDDLGGFNSTLYLNIFFSFTQTFPEVFKKGGYKQSRK